MIEGASAVLTDSVIADRINQFLSAIGVSIDIEPDAVRSGSAFVDMALEIDDAVSAIIELAYYRLDSLGIRWIVLHNPYPHAPIDSLEELNAIHNSDRDALVDLLRARNLPENEDLAGDLVSSHISSLSRLGSFVGGLTRFTHYPILHAVFTLVQLGRVAVVFEAGNQWLLRPTVPAPNLLATGIE